MNIAQLHEEERTNLPFYEERVDLACAFRWTARLNMHEAVANHFSLAVNDDGTQLPDEPQPGAFLAHQGERPAADRRQRSRDAEPAPMRPTRPPGACTARSTATCRMRAASCMCTRSTRPCSPRWPIRRCRRSTRTRRCSSTATSSTTTMAGWPSRKRASAARKLLVRPEGQGHDHGQPRHPGHRRHRRRRLQPHVLFRARRRDLHQGAVDRPAAAHAVRRDRREDGAARWTTIPARPNGTSPS